MSIVEKIKARLQRRRRCRSSSSIFARSVSLSTSSCRSSSHGSFSYSSSGTWDCSDWNGSSSDDEDHNGSSCAAAPDDVPEGYLAVYVGEERRRCVMSARHLSHPWFKALLEKAAEEFGFDHKEGLRLPCDVVAFKLMVEKLDKESERRLIRE